MKCERKTGLAYDPACKLHLPRPGHPERPERIDAALAGAGQTARAEDVIELGPRAVSDRELELCHTPNYIALVKHEIAAGLWQLSTGDTEVCEDTLDAALAAVGCVLAAVDAVFQGSVANAFCVVRPPGHHAAADCGMGFCVFNNIAIAARYAQREYGVERVLVADWDVHHGNGTQAIFRKDPSVFYFSTHQSPLYPGTGRAAETGVGEGTGATLNCPLAMGMGRTQILTAFREKLVPAMREFRPQFVLVSAGFDAAQQDPIGGLTLTHDDFAELTQVVMDIADEHAESRLVSVLEGGYDLLGLMNAAAAHFRALTGQ